MAVAGWPPHLYPAPPFFYKAGHEPHIRAPPSNYRPGVLIRSGAGTLALAALPNPRHHAKDRPDVRRYA
ncbi:MAG: hypothetical protein A3D16_13940 [Rhodobacterales bacterium RIFCSPHIGHO2_02_FULL_62_130]|nr:MAG: hypothetical protein A3D16_13940 [Rhodobacterales bacterium RIFCSPHIGHO2_02_FULL_62_130]HCY98739.1 hypothetical protein [Rhodobacter sp.]